MSRRRKGTPRPANVSPVPSRGRMWWPPLLIAAVGGVVFSNSWSGPFILDDRLSILENATLRHLWPLSGALFAERESPFAGRPLVNLSFAINYAFSGLAVESYHMVNVAIHLLCALVLFGIVRRTLDAVSIHNPPWTAEAVAASSAILWLVHPLNTEAVNYLTQRTELMMALFYLLALYGSIRAYGTGERPGWQIASVVACGLGMACKESMVTAPIMIALYDRAFLFESFRRAVNARGRLYMGLAASWVIVGLLLCSGPRKYSAGFSTGVHPWVYLLNQAHMIVQYLHLAVWPRLLVFTYGYPRAIGLHDVWPSALIVMLLLLSAVGAWLRRPTVAFLATWFFVTLAPSSSIVPIATEVGAERRMYLPLAALVVLAVNACAWAITTIGSRSELFRSPRRRLGLGLAIVAVVTIAFSIQTISRNRDYQSALILAETSLARWPTADAHHLVGVELLALGRHEEAMPELREAAREQPRAYYPLGVELYRQERWAEAFDELQQFVQRQPSLLEVVPARELMGLTLVHLGKLADAEAQFRAVLSMRPSALDARAELADTLANERRYDEAIVEYRAYLARRPDNAQVLSGLGRTLAALGKDEEAIAVFRRASDGEPNNAIAARNLAIMLFEKDDAAGAAIYARRAVDNAPSDAIAHDILGISLAYESRVDEGVAELRRSIALDPANADARDHLRRILQMQASPRQGR